MKRKRNKEVPFSWEFGSVNMYVNTNSNHQDSDYAEIYDSMN